LNFKLPGEKLDFEEEKLDSISQIGEPRLGDEVGSVKSFKKPMLNAENLKNLRN